MSLSLVSGYSENIHSSQDLSKSDKKIAKKEELNSIKNHSKKLGKFNGCDIHVSKFQELSKDFEKLGKMKAIVDAHSQSDKKIKEKKRDLKKIESSTSPKDNLFMHKEGQVKDNQKLIPVKAPKVKNDGAQKYWKMVVEKQVPLMITLCSPFERNTIAPFWNPTTIDKVSTKIAEETGVVIRHEKKKVLYEGMKIKHKNQQKQVKIIERTYSLTNRDGRKHTATHLQYRHWPDHQAGPDEKALNILFARRRQLVNDRNRPIVVNCKGGVGRTGEFVLAECLVNEIDNKVNRGIPLNKITLNIPEMIYNMRKFAPNIVGKSTEQLSQVCQIVFNRYKALKS